MTQRDGDRVNEERQIQRLLMDARDPEAFSRLLIDSVCAMPADDFRRVRDRLIRKFVADRRRAAGIGGEVSTTETATVKSESVGDDRTRSEEDATTSRSSLSLKIVSVRSCSVDDATEEDGSWAGGDWTPMKEERPVTASCPASGQFIADRGVDDLATPTNYITIAPIETTDAVNSAEEMHAIESRDDNQAQCRRVDVTDFSPASAVLPRESGQVYLQHMKQQRRRRRRQLFYGLCTGQPVCAAGGAKFSWLGSNIIIGKRLLNGTGELLILVRRILTYFVL